MKTLPRMIPVAVVALLVLASLLLAWRLGASIPDQAAVATPAPPPGVFDKKEPLPVTYAGSLARGFGPEPGVELCITGMTGRQEAAAIAASLRRQFGDRVSESYLPVGITVTLKAPAHLPTDLIDVYVNEASDGTSTGRWIHVSALGLTGGETPVLIDDGRLPLAGRHLLVVEARYGNEARSLWTESGCASIVYDYDDGVFAAGEDAP